MKSAKTSAVVFVEDEKHKLYDMLERLSPDNRYRHRVHERIEALDRTAEAAEKELNQEGLETELKTLRNALEHLSPDNMFRKKVLDRLHELEQL